MEKKPVVEGGAGGRWREVTVQRESERERESERWREGRFVFN